MLDEFLAVRLATAGAVARRTLDRACRQQGRPVRELLALMAAADLERRLTPTSMADRLGLQRSEVCRLLHELHYDGSIVKHESAFDQRAHVVEVPERESVLLAGRGTLSRVDRSLRRNLTRTRQKQLGECLEALKGPATPVADVLSGI